LFIFENKNKSWLTYNKHILLIQCFIFNEHMLIFYLSIIDNALIYFICLYFLFLALWIRLANRFNDPLPLPKPFMEQVWLICRKVKDLQFYKLETPREPLVIFDRYEFVHPDLGIILEPVSILYSNTNMCILCIYDFL